MTRKFASLSKCWFDYEKTTEGLNALRQYRWATNDKGQAKDRPEHSWASHAADSFRYMCTAISSSTNWESKIKYPKLAIV